jgi:hypothetical protein
MKSLVCLLFLAIAQSSANASETERILTRLENDWAHALVRRDTATFHRLIAPGFVYTEDATVMNKEELIRSIVADRMTDMIQSRGSVFPLTFSHESSRSVLIAFRININGIGAAGCRYCSSRGEGHRRETEQN